MSSSSPERNANCFYLAAFAGKRQEIQEYLAAGWDPDTLTGGTNLPLLSAVTGRNLEIVKDLLAAGASVDGVIPTSLTPLMAAMATHNLQIGKVLLDAGADVQCTNEKGFTALHYGRRSPECVELLRKHGLIVEKREVSDPDREMREKAIKDDLIQRIDAEEDDVALAILLSETMVCDMPDMAIRAIRQGADVALHDLEGEDQQDWSVAAWAAWHGYTDVLRLAVKAGADLDRAVEREGLWAPPIFFAIEAAHFEEVKILVEAGADVNATGSSGRSQLNGPALLLAAHCNYKDIYDYLRPLTDEKFVQQAEELLHREPGHGSQE